MVVKKSVSSSMINTFFIGTYHINAYYEVLNEKVCRCGVFSPNKLKISSRSFSLRSLKIWVMSFLICCIWATELPSKEIINCRIWSIRRLRKAEADNSSMLCSLKNDTTWNNYANIIPLSIEGRYQRKVT